MDDPSIEVHLPPSVEQLLEKICVRHLSPPPGFHVRRRLSSIGEQAAVKILQMIVSVSTSRIKCVDAYIMTLVKKYAPNPNPNPETVSLSPHTPASSCFSSPGDFSYNSPITKQFMHSPSPSNGDFSYNSPITKQFMHSPSPSNGIFPDDNTSWSFNSPIPIRPIFPSNNNLISEQLLILGELEFRKFFLVLSYIGRKRLEDVISVDDANYILRKTQEQVESMVDFESRIWSHIGSKHCETSDRIIYLDWDAGKTHLYYCYVLSDGGYYFKGPYLKGTRTHLQRAVGDGNVLIVKFEPETDISSSAASSINWNSAYGKIIQDGILVSLRRYQLFDMANGAPP